MIMVSHVWLGEAKVSKSDGVVVYEGHFKRGLCHGQVRRRLLLLSGRDLMLTIML
jgi:hypothetical protein